VRERYKIAATKKRTVNYRTKHPSHYANAAIKVPDGAYTQEQLKKTFAPVRTQAGMAEIVNAIGFFPRLT
jgi:hypothetical protein